MKMGFEIIVVSGFTVGRSMIIQVITLVEYKYTGGSLCWIILFLEEMVVGHGCAFYGSDI